MITSFFSKSKPINIVLVTFLISIVFVLAKYQQLINHFSFYELVQQIGFLLAAIFSIFILDFIIAKNTLTKQNNYAILFFGLFIALIPQSIIQSNLLFSNIFILLALRRLISLHSKQDIKKKLIDAAFWIGIASLFYFWAILFFSAVLIALLFYSQKEIKNWIVPFVALLVVVLLVVSYNIIFLDSILPEKEIYPGMSLDFSSLNNYKTIISTTIIVTLFVWTAFFFIKAIREKMSKFKPAYILIMVFAIIALIILVIVPIKTSGEFIFLFAPLAIITTSYLEKVNKKWLIETLAISLLIISIVFLVL